MNPCGHSDHEYNPYAERHECCDSRYCHCTCAGAKEREERYARDAEERHAWLSRMVAKAKP